MKSMISIIIFSALLASVSSALTNNQKSEILKQHNKYRSAEGAGNMIMMTWCDELAKQAQAYADTCSGSKHSDAADYGENLYASQNQGVNMGKAVKAWFDEKELTNWPESPVLTQEAFNKGTGHYTQVVWSDSHYLGCGQTNCSKENKWDNSIVCQYKKKGNFLNKTLWVKGAPCSNCPAGFDKCIDNMCAGGDTSSCPTNLDTTHVDTITEDESLQISKFCKVNGNFDRVKPNSLKKCENCIYSAQCADERYCCPYMKKCVLNSTEGCSIPVAKCSNCFSEFNVDPSKCTCEDEKFPENWMDCNHVSASEKGETSEAKILTDPTSRNRSWHIEEYYRDYPLYTYHHLCNTFYDSTDNDVFTIKTNDPNVQMTTLVDRAVLACANVSIDELTPRFGDIRLNRYRYFLLNSDGSSFDGKHYVAWNIVKTCESGYRPKYCFDIRFFTCSENAKDFYSKLSDTSKVRHDTTQFDRYDRFVYDKQFTDVDQLEETFYKQQDKCQ